MNLYTAGGDFRKKEIIENFDENNSNDICFVKDDNKICLNFKEIKIILEKHNLNELIKKKLHNKNEYSMDSGKYIPSKSSLLFVNTNVNDCKDYCDGELWCKSFSYNFKNANCLISNISKLNNEFIPNYNVNYYEKLK
jgi:hypothetical protein